MEPKRKKKLQTERPKVRRVYVSLVNPDNRNEDEHFTAYEAEVKDLKRRIINQPVEPSVA
jgi:hypothetical protein